MTSSSFPFPLAHEPPYFMDPMGGQDHVSNNSYRHLLCVLHMLGNLVSVLLYFIFSTLQGGHYYFHSQTNRLPIYMPVIVGERTTAGICDQV